jgi:hypothetical protein
LFSLRVAPAVVERWALIGQCAGIAKPTKPHWTAPQMRGGQRPLSDEEIARPCRDASDAFNCCESVGDQDPQPFDFSRGP